jgi:hypothetical protein
MSSVNGADFTCFTSTKRQSEASKIRVKPVKSAPSGGADEQRDPRA